jgi:hypothetical protein
MNIFDLDIEQLDLDEARAALSSCPIELLPGIPPLLSKKECAAILGVSAKVIDHLIEAGQLPLTDIPNESTDSTDLFGASTVSPRETCVLRADLIMLFEKLLFCNKPVLDPEND